MVHFGLSVIRLLWILVCKSLLINRKYFLCFALWSLNISRLWNVCCFYFAQMNLCISRSPKLMHINGWRRFRCCICNTSLNVKVTKVTVSNYYNLYLVCWWLQVNKSFLDFLLRSIFQPLPSFHPVEWFVIMDEW